MLSFIQKPLEILSGYYKDFFQKDSDNFVAINIGNSTLKGVVVKAKTITSPFTEKNTDLSLVLKKLVNEKKIPCKQVKLSLKNPSCLVRYFNFPKMDKRRMRQTLFYEINKFIPFSAEEVYFDFAVLRETGPSEALLLLAVAKKSYIESILETFAKCNLKISEISTDSVCLINLFGANYGESGSSNACLLDMGYHFSTMTIVHKGIPFLTRDVKFCTSDIAQMVSRIKNISLSQAEEWLRHAPEAEEFAELAQDSISNLCKEMKSSIDYFEVNKGEHVDKVFLSGGIAGTPGIEKLFVELLDIPVEILRIASQSKDSESTAVRNDSAEIGNGFAVCVGLAI